MLIEIIEGQPSIFKNRSARVGCENCSAERVVQYKTIYKKTQLICKSCTVSARQAGRTFTSEHCKAISKGLRKKGGDFIAVTERLWSSPIILVSVSTTSPDVNGFIRTFLNIIL